MTAKRASVREATQLMTEQEKQSDLSKGYSNPKRIGSNQALSTDN